MAVRGMKGEDFNPLLRKRGEKGLGNGIGNQILLERATEMAEQLLGKRKENGPDEDERPNDMEETFSQTAQRFKQFFPFDPHPDPFSTTNTESNVT